MACSLRSQEKHLKIFRALRAPCFVSKFSEKTPLCGFWSDDTRIKKLFLLFFPPPLSLLARAARRNFRFFPGIFLLKRSQDEVRSVWKSSKILDFLSGRFVMLHFHYIVEKKHCCGPLKPNPSKYDVASPPSCENWYMESINDINTEKSEKIESPLHRSSKSQVWDSVDL